MTAPREVDAIADQYVEDAAALDPAMAAYAGIAGHDHRLPDLSPEGFAERVDVDRRALAAARAAVPVDERERLAQDAFVERLGLKVEMAEAGITSSQVSVTAGPLQNVRGILDLMPTEGEEAQRNIALRLAAVPAALEGYQETLRDAAARGQVSAQRQLGEVASQIRRWTAQDGGSDLFHRLVGGLDADGPLADDLTRGADAASAAYAELGGSSVTSWLRSAASARRSAARSTPCAAATSSAPRWTSRRRTPGAGRS